MPEAFDHQLAVLMKEWDQCETGVGRYDTIMFSIRTWAVTLSTAAIGAAASVKNPDVILIGIVPTILLFLIDSVNKSYQYHYTQRVRQIQTYLSSENFRDDSVQRTMSFRTPLFASSFALGGIRQLRALKRSAMRLSVWITYISILVFDVVAYIGFQLAGVHG